MCDQYLHPLKVLSSLKIQCYESLVCVCCMLQALLERGQAELAADRQAFSEKSRKLDAIMKQVQGLQET